jgi:hypothetical protein
MSSSLEGGMLLVRRPALARASVLSGSLAELPLTDILQLLASSKKSGTLHLGERALHLERGLIVGCTSGDPSLTLAERVQRTLLETLDAPPAEFSFTLETHGAELATEALSPTAVVLDALRLLDERGSAPLPEEPEALDPAPRRRFDLDAIRAVHGAFRKHARFLVAAVLAAGTVLALRGL